MIANPRQVTDVHLLGLALGHEGCLATFDRGLRLSAVRGAEQSNLAVIGVAED